MADNTFGLLSQYGLDLGTEDDVRSQLRAKRIQDAMRFVAPQAQGINGRTADPGNIQQSSGMFGAAVGNAIGEKFRQPQSEYGNIPPEIQNRLNTTKQSKALYEEWERANPESKLNDRQEKFQEIMAETAFKNDLPEVGIGVLRELTDRRDARKKRDLELEKLGNDTKYERDTLKARIFKTNVESGKAGLVEAYASGSRDPNSSVVGMFNPEDKSLTITGDDGQPVVVPYGKWKLDRPVWDPARTNNPNPNHMKLTPTEEGKLRHGFVSSMNLQRKYIDVFKLLDKAAENKLGPIQGKMGGFLQAANSWIGFAEQLATLASPTGKPLPYNVTTTKTGLMGGVTTKTVDMADAGQRHAYAAENAEEITKQLRGYIPGLAEKGEAAYQLAALLSDIAYAKAMANEDGASRSLSDLDFKTNMISIGKDLNTPGALKRQLLADADRVNQAVADTMSVYGNENLTRYIDPDGLARLADIRGQLDPYRKDTEVAPSSGVTQRPRRMTKEEWIAAGRPKQ